METKITKTEWIEISIEDLFEDAETIDINGLSIRKIGINEKELTITLFGATSQYGVVSLPFSATTEEIKLILADPLNGILKFLNKELDLDEILENA